MTRALPALLLLVVGSLSLAACKKDPDPQAIPVPSASAPPPDPTPATAAPTATVAPVQQPVVVNRPQESIDACCAALAAIQKSGVGAVAKVKAGQAAAVCPGIARLVKTGQTGRAAGLTQIRSSLAGTTVPGECM